MTERFDKVQYVQCRDDPYWTNEEMIDGRECRLTTDDGREIVQNIVGVSIGGNIQSLTQEMAQKYEELHSFDNRGSCVKIDQKDVSILECKESITT